MMVLVFWASYIMLVMGLIMWVAKHPLSVGAAVLFLYMLGSVVAGFVVSFVVGVFLFLTGVSGMMVAFLYVVALCPNPVFMAGGDGVGYQRIVVLSFFVGVVWPVFGVVVSGYSGLAVEMSSVSEFGQWLRDPLMWGGLAELMPFLGILLFLCMVSVVTLCGQQKQCLGGHDLAFTKRSYS